MAFIEVLPIVFIHVCMYMICIGVQKRHHNFVGVQFTLQSHMNLLYCQ